MIGEEGFNEEGIDFVLLWFCFVVVFVATPSHYMTSKSSLSFTILFEHVKREQDFMSNY